jgi:hypothetical protein
MQSEGSDFQMEKLRFKLTGVSPLIMHNGRLADPLDYYTKKIGEVSKKRKKTEADHEQMAKLEWLGSLYLSDEKPCIPSHVIEAVLIGKGGAARKMRMGKQAMAGLIVEKDAILEYDGPQDLEELYKDERFRLRAKVNIQGASVIRTRPIFHPWSAEIEVLYLPELIDKDTIIQWAEIAGAESGLMDWRPKFGRFTAELLDDSQGVAG